MHRESVTATKFSRNVASYLDHVRYTGESVAITKGTRVVAELVPAKPTGLPIEELAALIADAPKLGSAGASMTDDLKKIRDSSKDEFENPWE